MYNNQKLSVVYNGNNQPAHQKGRAIDDLYSAFIVNTNYDTGRGCIAIGTMGTNVEFDSGDIISVYFRPIPNMVNDSDLITDLVYSPQIQALSLNNNHLNPDAQPIEYEISETFEYYDAVSYSFNLGNINGDGSITVADAQNILLMLSAYQGVLTTDTETNVFDNDPNFSGLFIEINGVSTLVLHVADVNFDGIIDTTDASLVLQYVAEGVSGTPHPDECQIGEEQTRVKYFLCFTN